MIRRLFLVIAVAVVVRPAPSTLAQPATTDNLILITLDGARVEEMFGGLDLDVLRSTLDTDQKSPTHPCIAASGRIRRPPAARS